MKIVPDTSIVIDGRLKRFLEQNTVDEIILPELVIAEVEYNANKRTRIGITGLQELTEIREYCLTHNIMLTYYGERTHDYRDMDEKIRKVAEETNSILVTGDFVQGKIADAKGISCLILEKEVETEMKIEDFFDPQTLSVHLKEDLPVLLKTGKPGDIDLVRTQRMLNREELEAIALDIVERARQSQDSFIELDEKGATVVQLREYRIAITQPPFSDRMEITAVRPLKKLALPEYTVSGRLLARFEKAEGILVSGSPGAGKSTFVQSLAEFYKDKGKIVKTMEKPRDLQVSEEITQYTALRGSMAKTADILLLTRPDFTVFDEMRKTEDFQVFADMRLAGVGMVGVVHATDAIDAVQRFIGRIELGMIPQVIDTIVHIENGDIGTVLNLTFSVKVPHGMSEPDLARPVIEAKDFESGVCEFEIYSYGEQIVVMPVKKQNRTPPKKILKNIDKFVGVDYRLEQVAPNKGILYVPKEAMAEIIGKKGKTISQIEKEVNMNLDVKPMEEQIPVNLDFTKRAGRLSVSRRYRNVPLNFYCKGEPLFSATVGKKGVIKIDLQSKLAHTLYDIWNRGDTVYAKEE
ncbi:MAG: Flp pilus assembly complex ATPase component TadA [Theionarchaea archaeon]|nr:Flp pilus assembly complex ATPase component TadA [Theionarchaea archaeon]MBU6999146.1 Flp pilus assembly complex ATPase component TadA [Theionarchaea archaeon]MBU7019507.1 Flp pilus assembly complex ATPase component TadA [Theionarchaea archaeon]MBU7034939.1 Flp pilus assembly complex ATPase component TadA [Theionarchaea archaeon]MBU7040779.1 Flp pilus assembly complex ATPase component TadA [Theionarchaea archaeon]